jgi:hypothetical protein
MRGIFLPPRDSINQLVMELLYYLRNQFRRYLRRLDFPAIVAMLTFQYRNQNGDPENAH